MSAVYINKSGSIIDVGSDDFYVVNGNDDAILIGGESTLVARGSGLVIDAVGTDDVIAVGGNGATAIAPNNNLVVFHAPGELREFANSSVEVQADQTKLAMAGDDTLGVFGSGDNVYAAGVGDRLSMGQNGAYAARADRDAVLGLENGSLFVLENSTVWADGDKFSATIVGHDELSAFGCSVQIYAMGDNNTVTTGGNNQAFGDDDVVHMNGGVVNLIRHSSAEIFGDNLFVRAYGNDAVCLTGTDDRMVLGMFGNNVTIGQDGNSNAVDIVQFSYTPFVEPVTVLRQSNVRIVGSNASVMLGGDDHVVLIGYHEQIVDQTGNNYITVGGNGSVFFDEANNYLSVSPGDTITMLSNSNLTLFSAGSGTNAQYTVHMSVKDALSVDSGMTVYVPVAVSDDLLLNFGSSDVLQLSSHFSSVGDLLAHTTQDSLGRTVVQLDAGSDTLTLGMDKATFASYAQEGLVKFR